MVSLELRASAVTELADVVFPVAAVAEKSGAFVNWEGRHRPFGAALAEFGTLDEGRILDTLGVEMDVDLYTQTPVAARADMGRLGVWTGSTPAAIEAPDQPHGLGSIASTFIHSVERGAARLFGHDETDSTGGFVLASWRMNLDGSRGLDGEPHLAGTAKPEVCRLSAADAARLGLRNGDDVKVSGPSGGVVTLPLAVTDMVRRRGLAAGPRPGDPARGAARGRRRPTGCRLDLPSSPPQKGTVPDEPPEQHCHPGRQQPGGQQRRIDSGTPGRRPVVADAVQGRHASSCCCCS